LRPRPVGFLLIVSVLEAFNWNEPALARDGARADQVKATAEAKKKLEILVGRR
jgi:hypothetical protein